MAAYGKGQMLGSGINPESFKQDYSGFSRAAEIQAQGLQNLGASIGGAIQNYGEMKKSQQADERAVQKSKSVAKAIGDLIPDLKPTLKNSLEILDNKELPLSQRKAEADAISDILNLGIGEIRNASAQQIEQSKLESDAAYKARQIKIAQQNADSRTASAAAAGKAAPPTINMPLGDGGLRNMQWDAESNSFIPTRTSGLGGTTQTAKGDDLISLVKDFEKFEPKAYNDYKQISVGYGTKGKPGEVLTEEQASERLQSELFGHAKRIEDAAALKGITLNKNQFNALTSFDFNTGKGANLIERFGDDPQQLASKILEYNKAGGEVKGGLVKRRQIEAALFLSPEQQAEEVLQATPQNQGGIGVTPPKNVETFRPFTPEEKARYGSDGQVSSTGKVYLFRQPSGTEFTINPDGSTTYRQGAGVGSKSEALAKTKRASEFEETRQTNFIIDKANEAEEIIDYSISTYGPGTLVDIAKSTIPGTQEYKLKNQILPAMKDSIALSSLKQLKAASPTGASGLGSLTEKEGKRLENMYGVLDVGGDKVTLKNDIKRLKQTVFDYIHGSKNEREKALADGVITKEQNDQVEQMYREQILGLAATPAPTATSTEDFGISPDAQAARERQKQRRNKQ